MILTFKGSHDYRRWLHRLAAHCRTTSVGVIDLALVDYAKRAGFDEPAPPRNADRSPA